MVKVLMAKHYARIVFDRELHDSLLQQVLEAPAEQPGLTLVNTLAQAEAAKLLAGRVGITIPEKPLTSQQIRTQSEKEELFEINKKAANTTNIFTSVSF